MSAPNYFEFKVIGAPELDKVLAGLPVPFQRRMLIGGMKRAVKPILKGFRLAAPVDSGDAKKSIKIRVVTRSKFPAITIGPDQEHWYLMYSEFGTANQPERPWMRPVWDMRWPMARLSFVKETFAHLEDQAKKMKQKAYAGKLSRPARRALGL